MATSANLLGTSSEDYRRKLAEMMAVQGLDASPVQSPWQGAARLAQAIVGGLMYQKMQGSDAETIKALQGLPGLSGSGGAAPAVSPPMPSPVAGMDTSGPTVPGPDPTSVPSAFLPPPPVAPAAPAPAPSANLPRGFRNNNPLNIEAGSFTSGQPGFAGSDGRFAKFENMDQGLTAAEKLLDVYGRKHGLDTVSGIINRWAPPTDNNPTSAYAATVAKGLGVDPFEKLNLSANPETRRRLVERMAEFENGRPLPAPGSPGVPGSPAMSPSMIAAASPPMMAAPPPAQPFQPIQMAQAGGGVPGLSSIPQPVSPTGRSGVTMPDGVAQTIREMLGSKNAGTRAMGLQLYQQYAKPPQWEKLDDSTLFDKATAQTRRVSQGFRQLVSPEERAVFGIDPKDTRRWQIDLSNNRLGLAEGQGTNINVAATTERKGNELMVQKGVDAFDTATKAAADATRRRASYGQMAEAMKGFDPGATAEFKYKAKSILKDMGIIGDVGVSDAEAFKSIQRRVELAATPKGQGSITENERALIREGYPMMSQSPEGISKIIGQLQRLDDYDMKVAQLYRENARKNGGVPNYLEVTEQIAQLPPALSEGEMYALQDLIQRSKAAREGGAPPPANTPRAPGGTTRGGIPWSVQ